MRENFWLDLAYGLKTFTSKNAFCPFSQKSLAATSTRASTSWFEVAWLRTSPVSG